MKTMTKSSIQFLILICLAISVSVNSKRFWPRRSQSKIEINEEEIITGIAPLIWTCLAAIIGIYLFLRKQESSQEDEQEKETLVQAEIGFEDIKMTLKQKKKKGERVILDASIQGKASPGRMLAIMGPSGSGKTTLIQALAGRIKQNKKINLSGRRYVNHTPVEGDSQIPSAFIEQETNFFPHMTVRETLDFRVELKLGKKIGKSARDDFVDDLIQSLSLTKSENTIVGNSKIRGVSGGERKRLSIACEMISSPSIIFLDEPTSGLDSYQAAQVVETLRKLADSGKTVIAVIHQPSQKVFSMFDDLLLLSEGRQMYFGEVKTARSYFENIGYPCAKEVGTAEHVIDLISLSNDSNGNEAVSKSHEQMDKIAARAVVQVEKSAVRKETSNNTGTRHFYGPEKARASVNVFRQFKVLLTRALKEVFRGKRVIFIKVAQQVTIAIIYGGIYHLGNNQSSIMDRVGLISLVTIGGISMALAGTIRSFAKEKAIVSTEMGAHLYATAPYFVAKAISEIPLVGFYSSIFGAILYPLVGLQKGRLTNFLGLSFMSSLSSLSVGLLIGSYTSSEEMAMALYPPIFILNVIFDGRNISIENTPRLLRWLPKIGLIRWGIKGLILNEFKGLTFDTSGPFEALTTKTGEEALLGLNIIGGIGECFRAQLNIVVVSWILSYLGLSLTRQKFQVMKFPDN